MNTLREYHDKLKRRQEDTVRIAIVTTQAESRAYRLGQVNGLAQALKLLEDTERG